MIQITPHMRILVAVEPIDFRAGIDGLVSHCRKLLQADPFGGALFVFCTWILHAAAIATNLDRRLFMTTVIGLSCNVGLNLLFIPRWGITGAALIVAVLTVT